MGQNNTRDQAAGEYPNSSRLVALGLAAASAPWLIPVNFFVKTGAIGENLWPFLFVICLQDNDSTEL